MDKEVVKKNSAGSLATINLRGDAARVCGFCARRSLPG